MGKVTLTFEDRLEGGVKVVSDPTFEVMAMMANSGSELTSAHGYALYAIRSIREESKKQSPTKILIPRLGH